MSRQDRIETLHGQGFVELIDSLGDDKSVVRSARVSYAGDREDDRPWSKDKRLIHYLVRNRHTSPLESVVFTFHVKAPIFVARQWMRHRTWAYNEVSARYTELDDGYYTPQEWRGQSKDNKQMSDGLISGWDQPVADDHYRKAVELSDMTYHHLIRMGVSREMARMVLPVSTFTRFYATVNLNNFLKFLSLRDHEHAQEEIREYAQAMRILVQPIVPTVMEAWEQNKE